MKLSSMRNPEVSILKRAVIKVKLERVQYENWRIILLMFVQLTRESVFIKREQCSVITRDLFTWWKLLEFEKYLVYLTLFIVILFVLSFIYRYFYVGIIWNWVDIFLYEIFTVVKWKKTKRKNMLFRYKFLKVNFIICMMYFINK